MKSMESKIHFSSAGLKEYDWLVVYSPLQDWEYCVLLAKDTGYKNCSKLDRLVKSITLSTTASQKFKDHVKSQVRRTTALMPVKEFLKGMLSK